MRQIPDNKNIINTRYAQVLLQDDTVFTVSFNHAVVMKKAG